MLDTEKHCLVELSLPLKSISVDELDWADLLYHINDCFSSFCLTVLIVDKKENTNNGTKVC
jgi:hypothetical protein